MAQTYGSLVRAPELWALLEFVFQKTADVLPPLCIWGKHGIGKTQIVRDFARRTERQFRALSPAQFEEMGDLLGLPALEGSRTVLRPPSWVPDQPGPGILLIDDVNRADDRILRGLMPLLQQGQLASWSLPLNWHIVLTANPDEGDYSVTPMDEAMLTRMMHVHLIFDHGSWLDWAGRAGLDLRGIDFVARHPELITGRRTTPRSLEQFLRLAAPVQDWKGDIELLYQLAAACLDEETVTGLLQFIRSGMYRLPRPQDILDRGDLSGLADAAPSAFWSVQERLLRHLSQLGGRLTAQQLAHLKAFLLHPALPADLRLYLAQRLIAQKRSELNDLLADPEVGTSLL